MNCSAVMLPPAAIVSTVSTLFWPLKHQTLQYLEAYFHTRLRSMFEGMEFQSMGTSAFVGIALLLILPSTYQTEPLCTQARLEKGYRREEP